MNLPNYLANIKSSGIYRFVWDKSQVPPQTAETLRLVVGYSEKGPFNTPVYVESVSDFISIYGNISKRLERRGIFFHRMALQALATGPILALNIKPFNDETVTYTSFSAYDYTESGIDEKFVNECEVAELYDRNRFWTLNADKLPSIGNKYINIFSTDVKDSSCTIFVRPFKPSNYNLTLQQWYSEISDEPASYLSTLMHENLQNFFAEVFVFRGEMTDDIKNGVLKDYFKDGVINTEYKNIYGELTDALEVMSTDPRSNFVARYRGCTIPYFKDANGNYIALDVLFNAGYNNHKMLMKLDEEMLDGTDNLSLQVQLEMNGKTISTISSQVDGTLNGSINRFISFSNIGDDKYVFNAKSTPNLPLSPIYMQGYTYETIGKGEKGYVLIDKLLEVLNDKGIRTALTNRVDVEYHYIVDTFQSYVQNNCNKSILAKIAKEKDNAFAILNFPAMEQFVEDSNYISDVTGKFDINLIPLKYSLATEVNGASHCAYYTQIVLSDGTLKSIIPSAALISNKFMEKWSSRQPYYIVAGPTYGRISWDGLVGPDYNFGRSDLDVLEPMGVNAVVYVPRKGTYVNSNQTAKQNPVTALSKIHIRELVIFLQNEIQAMLENYHWELNTQTLRDTIKAKADSILETVKNNGGVYEYLNVCDETNNTNEIIDNEMLILDTHIEPARGAGKMIHNLTIYRTGEMSSMIK